jgi:hypothetical protein
MNKFDHNVDCFECTFCETHACSDQEVLETKDGDIACEQCQYDACAYFGQMRSNIKHTRMLERLVIQWSEE